MPAVLDRRAVLAAAAGGLAVLAAPALARAQTLAGVGRFAAAAAYSAQRKGVSFLVARGGETLAEAYPSDGAIDRGWELASGTKSFSGVLAARMIAEGRLVLDAACADVLPEWRGDARKSRITLRQLLTLTSGLDTRVGRGRAPTAASALAEPAVAERGALFAYGQTAFAVFAEIVRRRLLDGRGGGARTALDHLRSEFFEPLGIRPTRWRTAPDDAPTLSHGASLTARDWAAFGRFVLDARAAGGTGNGIALDPAAFQASFTGTAANPGYGLTWWVLQPGLIGPSPRAGVGQEDFGPIADEGVVMAAGAGNQRLYLLPARDTVVVRQASGVGAALLGRGPDWSDLRFMTMLLDAL